MTLTGPLHEHLATFVSLEILELQRQGGPTQEHFEEMQRRRAKMEEKSGFSWPDEAILYYDKGRTAQSVGFLVECLAIMSFVPGGVKFGPLHFWPNREKDLREIN